MLETKCDGDRLEMLLTALTIFIISEGRNYLKDVTNIFLLSPTSESPTFPDVGDRIWKVDDIFRIFVPEACVKKSNGIDANGICRQHHNLVINIFLTSKWNFPEIFENSHQNFNKANLIFQLKHNWSVIFKAPYFRKKITFYSKISKSNFIFFFKNDSRLTLPLK